MSLLPALLDVSLVILSEHSVPMISSSVTGCKTVYLEERYISSCLSGGHRELHSPFLHFIQAMDNCAPCQLSTRSVSSGSTREEDTKCQSWVLCPELVLICRARTWAKLTLRNTGQTFNIPSVHTLHTEGGTPAENHNWIGEGFQGFHRELN